MNFPIERGDAAVRTRAATMPDRLGCLVARFGGPLPAGIDTRSYLVVVVAAACLAATVAGTWRLWQPRNGPPNLPVFGVLASVPWAVPLLAATVWAVVRPRRGGPAFCALFLLAALGDQTRLQPEVVSLAILMTAPAFGVHGRSVARWHLATLWLWAGVHKVLSLGWATGGAAFIASSLRWPGFRPVVAILLPAVEIALGLAAMSRRTWPIAAWGGAALHLGALVTLAGFARWGVVIWPWNLALAVIALLLFAPPDDVPAAHPGAIAVATGMLVYPGLFYVGVTDAYLAHNLYTTNLPRAAVCTSDHDGCRHVFDTLTTVRVVLPPEPRLYRRLFDGSCRPGTVLRITGRATRLSDPPSVSFHDCPAPVDVRARA